MRKVSIKELRCMKDKEGLVLQGCGGDLQEWENGINDILTDQNILLNGTRFKNVMSFQKDGLTNLLFPFEDVEINIGKLSMWRLQTHGQFGGTWLSDYVDNKISENCQCGDCRHTDSLAAHGCPIMLTTGLAVSWKQKKNSSPTVH